LQNYSLKLKDRPLAEFCRRELEGWKDTGGRMIETGDEYPEYRTLTSYVSNISINTNFIGWGGSADNAIAYMERTEEQFIRHHRDL
jgi:hypothetical protein